jgi:sarcosine oxidase subunit gamma
MADNPAATTLGEACPAARFVLHAPDEALVRLGQAYGVALPAAINRAEGTPEGRAALKLGPDEWLLIAAGEDARPIATALAQAAGATPISLVEVSDRQLGFALAGPEAALALAAGMPLDLASNAFPAGMATRTIFEKAGIVLWRTRPDAFRIEIGRSFAPYVTELLAIAIRENAAAP